MRPRRCWASASWSLLDYHDQQLDRAGPATSIDGIARHIRRIRPDVVLTFGPDGAYGHPDHIAISQFTTAAIVAAAAHADGLIQAIRRTWSRSCITWRGRRRRGWRTRRRSAA